MYQNRFTQVGVIAALSERGIVHVEVQGNTNEVSLVKWFHDGMHR